MKEDFPFILKVIVSCSELKAAAVFIYGTILCVTFSLQ